MGYPNKIIHEMRRQNPINRAEITRKATKLNVKV